MSQQILVQPDGRLAVFSTLTDTFVTVDATPEELIEWRAEQAAQGARERARRELDRVLSGTPAVGRALTWDQACERDRLHGGDLGPGVGPPRPRVR